MEQSIIKTVEDMTRHYNELMDQCYDAVQFAEGCTKNIYQDNFIDLEKKLNEFHDTCDILYKQIYYKKLSYLSNNQVDDVEASKNIENIETIKQTIEDFKYYLHTKPHSSE